jgi:hypothetical protein
MMAVILRGRIDLAQGKENVCDLVRVFRLLLVLSRAKSFIEAERFWGSRGGFSGTG